jgi:hypothetical protein
MIVGGGVVKNGFKKSAGVYLSARQAQKLNARQAVFMPAKSFQFLSFRVFRFPAFFRVWGNHGKSYNKKSPPTHLFERGKLILRYHLAACRHTQAEREVRTYFYDVIKGLIIVLTPGSPLTLSPRICIDRSQKPLGERAG